MELISKQQIEDAANSYCSGQGVYIKTLANKAPWEAAENGFNSGAQFVLDQMPELMCEFLEEIIGDGWILRSDGWQNVMDFKISELDRYTTQQLLELFIEEKQKK